MKILIPVDPEIPVPPLNYGGVERLVDGLITAYRKKGHEVYMLANPASTARDAVEIFKWEALKSRGTVNVWKNAWKLHSVAREIRPDVIHSFGRLLYLYPTLLTSSIPVCMTYGRRISPYSTTLASVIGGRKIHFTSAAGHMLNHLKLFRHKFTPVYNFTLTDYYVPNDSLLKEHMMFLGRVEDIKGTHEAIMTAIATNQKLIIAGNIQPGHDEYFIEKVKPYLTNPLIQYVGSVNDEQKLYYLQRTRAFLFPIKWEEPFGIVMAEAMSCGVPVIAFRRGSVPEVVKDGINGFIVNNTEEMIASVKMINLIDRNVVRDDCVRRFSLDVISEQYLDLFKKAFKCDC